MKQILLAVVLLFISAFVSAQTGVTITGLTLTVQTAAGVPVGIPQTATWPPTIGSCGLTASTPVVGTLVNPGQLELDDPGAPTKVCRLNFSAYFATLPAATGYKASAQYRYSDGAVSGASNVTGPFDEVAAHPAPTGVGVRP